MNIRQAIQSGKRHRRKSSRNKLWFPVMKLVECRGGPEPDENGVVLDVLLIWKEWQAFVTERQISDCGRSSAGYSGDDIMADDWEIEE